MGIVVRVNGQVIEVDSVAELSWLGCMIDGNGNVTSNVNGNGAKYSEPETYGLLEYRKKYDKAKWAELREFIVTKYREDELTGAAINELCIEEYGCDVGNSTCYRLHKNME